MSTGKIKVQVKVKCINLYPMCTQCYIKHLLIISYYLLIHVIFPVDKSRYYWTMVLTPEGNVDLTWMLQFVLGPFCFSVFVHLWPLKIWMFLMKVNSMNDWCRTFIKCYFLIEGNKERKIVIYISMKFCKDDLNCYQNLKI